MLVAWSIARKHRRQLSSPETIVGDTQGRGDLHQSFHLLTRPHRQSTLAGLSAAAAAALFSEKNKITDISPVPWMLERIIDVVFDIPVLAVAVDASLPSALVAIFFCVVLSLHAAGCTWLYGYPQIELRDFELVPVWRLTKTARYANAILFYIM